MKICGMEFGEEILERIREVAKEPISRSELARKVCEWLGWRNSLGEPKEMSARVALGKLSKKGIVALPPPKGNGVKPARLLEESDPAWGEVCGGYVGALPGLGALRIVRVGTEAHSRLWNTLMERHHYLGKGPLCGAQIRYLVGSETQGWVGAAAFSSAAWKVDCRERRIGWSDAGRTAHLSRVVNNSRFLILPQVRVPHLASRALSLLIRSLPSDWERSTGDRPWLLETFVERDRFRGTCYKAANFECVGETRGLGRQGKGSPVKTVWLYSLDPAQMEALRTEPKASLPKPLPNASDWAEEEFGRADLPDRRLVDRLITVGRDFYRHPTAGIPESCEGDRAKAKAVYRLFDHKEMTVDVVLAAHKEATAVRAAQQPLVLCVQDTTELDYTGHPQTEGLGPIGNHRFGSRGLLVHDTMAFDALGTPLGLVHAKVWTRPVPVPKKRGRPKKKGPPETVPEKESVKWIESFEAVAGLARRCPETVFVSVGDREADFYELFEKAALDPDGPRLLVRALHPRKLVDDTELWESLAQKSPQGTIELLIPRKGGRPERKAFLDVRYREAEIRPPKSRKDARPVRLYAVMVNERAAPEGEEPLEWCLLTTAPVESLEEAFERVSWYAKRWGIEVYHRTLKSGCRIEERQLGNDHRIEACLGVDMVVAWRLFHLTKLARETPDLPCTIFFEEAEWQALCVYHSRNPVPPSKPPTLREATRMVAKIGGFLGRTCDGEPGTETLWRGIQALEILTPLWETVSEIVRQKSEDPVKRKRYG